MQTELVGYMHGLRVCLNCWYADFIPGVVPPQYVYTMGHDCPQCNKPKLSIRLIVLLSGNKEIEIRLLCKALTTASLYYNKEFKSIAYRLVTRGVLRNG